VEVVTGEQQVNQVAWAMTVFLLQSLLMVAVVVGLVPHIQLWQVVQEAEALVDTNQVKLVDQQRKQIKVQALVMGIMVLRARVVLPLVQEVVAPEELVLQELEAIIPQEEEPVVLE